MKILKLTRIQQTGLSQWEETAIRVCIGPGAVWRAIKAEHIPAMTRMELNDSSTIDVKETMEEIDWLLGLGG